MRVICMGDSLTYGYGVSRAEVWTALISDALGKVEVINRGISGDTTGGMLARLERDVLSERPDLVILMGGSNDIFFSQDLKSAKGNISAMVFQCLASRIKVILGIPFPVWREGLEEKWKPYAGGEETKGLLESYRSWLLEFGTRFEIQTIDFWKCLVEAGKPLGNFYLDGIHLNRAGHRLIGGFLFKNFPQKE